MNLQYQSQLHTVDELAAQGVARDNAQIVFVGPVQKFSDVFVRTVKNEIPNIETHRVDDLAALYRYRQTCAQRIWLVVLDSHLLRSVVDIIGFVGELRGNLARSEQAVPSIAFACETDACRSLKRDAAIALLRGHRGIEGFSGILPMSRPVDVWLEILRLFLSHGTYFPTELFLDLLEGKQGTASAATAPSLSERVVALGKKLTRREVQVLGLVADGLQNKQIASELSLSEHTVKLHIHNVISKLEVKNRTEAAAHYLGANGWA